MNPVHLIDTVETALLFACLTVCLPIGLVALCCPSCFARLNQWANRWVDSSNWFAWLDRSIDLDRFAVSHSRLFGATLLFVILGVSYALYR